MHLEIDSVEGGCTMLILYRNPGLIGPGSVYKSQVANASAGANGKIRITHRARQIEDITAHRHTPTEVIRGLEMETPA
jgi:hypothetical protein